MDSYRLLRPLLFALPPETAHHLSLAALDLLARLAGPGSVPEVDPVTVMGLRFPNRLGLAAGLDKNGDHIDALGRLGFGFIEVGTVTPRPQPGNRRPRLFRLPRAGALINRMGFNNRGVEHLVARIRQRRYAGVLGVNLGKNFDTPLTRALEDYRFGLRRVYPWADYVTVNLSSPNTPGLRDLQAGDQLGGLLGPLQETRRELAERTGRHVPLLVKVAPDLTDEAIAVMADTLAHHGVDGVIATNTTIDKSAVAGLRHGGETGGLSGRPLFVRSTEVLAAFRRRLPERVALVAAGGVFSRADFEAKRAAGADLVQVYTGLVYRGPALVREILSG